MQTKKGSLALRLRRRNFLSFCLRFSHCVHWLFSFLHNIHLKWWQFICIFDVEQDKMACFQLNMTYDVAQERNIIESIRSKVWENLLLPLDNFGTWRWNGGCHMNFHYSFFSLLSSHRIGVLFKSIVIHTRT